MLDTEPDLSHSLFSHIDFASGAVVAVSGGSDSTALLLLLKEHLDRTAPATKLLAVTIDHRLRPGSAAEARAVAMLCTAYAIPHRVLSWSGPKPSTGLPAAAREARYRLLAQAARAEGMGLILTGHTADDQAETVLMRQARQEGLGRDEGRGHVDMTGRDHADITGRGLAGMAPATLHDCRDWIVRPLLGTRRSALRDFLRRRQIGWAEDPTNTDSAFERPRMRTALAEEGGGRLVNDALALAEREAAARCRLGGAAADLIVRFAARPAAGLIRLDPALLTCGDEPAAIYALRILLATLGGVGFLPDLARGEALFGRLKTGFLCATLSRTVVDFRRAGIFLRREARGLPPAATAMGTMVWDGRRQITLDDVHRTMLIAPLGQAEAKRLVVDEGEIPPSLARAALATEPALWKASEVLALPGVSEPLVAPFARFLPSFDLAPARAVGRLIGAAPFPASPLRGDGTERRGAKA
ncbi:tRNA lysidine(34) synthetase TilS [Mesorhizobium sp. ES1-1]|uniref:tRNA lysidine(34) synthetase TilS n=1 Tax=Mesorhizobium sp. ES1-1 TaxID=2876629 RepID=UPI001CCEC2D7|nr:tRNA lysidine(34) synthetase TilS [Mesorhizobium sp. ES1-1]MBZ9675595.1 tRNA lysidine(34) synthetase TilS [Mesorhizobium sp. ES1-1]